MANDPSLEHYFFEGFHNILIMIFTSMLFLAYLSLPNLPIAFMLQLTWGVSAGNVAVVSRAH